MKKLALIALIIPIILIGNTINYQGKLTNTAGIGYSGLLDITFRIFNVSSAGTELWEELHTDVVIEKGLFAVLLGSSVDIDLPFDADYFVEIQIDGDILSPRMPLSWSAYAFRAAIADSLAGGGSDGDWNLIGNDIHLAVSRNVVMGSASPDTMNKLEITSRSLTGSKAVVGKSYAGAEGWLGTELHGVYGQFDSYNFGYLGGSGYGVYGEGAIWAGYFNGDVNITGDANLSNDMYLSSSSNFFIGGLSGGSGQVLSQTSTGMAWIDILDATSLWVDNGLAMSPTASIAGNLRVAQDQSYTYGFYATMETADADGYGGYFTSATTTGASTGIFAGASSIVSSEETTVAGEFNALSLDQVTYGTYTVAVVVDTSSVAIVRGNSTQALQSGKGEIAGDEVTVTASLPSNTATVYGHSVTTNNYGKGTMTGGLFNTENLNTQNTGIFSGVENYAQTIGKGESYGFYTQIVAANDTANLAQSYGISSAASYNGKSFLWGIYSWVEASDTGEVAAFYGQSLKTYDLGFNYGAYIYASNGEQVRGLYAYATGASGTAGTGNIGMFAYSESSSAMDIGIYARLGDYPQIGDYAGYFAGQVLATGYEYADLAEMYPDEGHIPDGSLVSLANSSLNPAEVTVEISRKPYDVNLVGVKSSKPAILMGRSENYKDYKDEETSLWQEKETLLSQRIPQITPPTKPSLSISPQESQINDTQYYNALKTYELQRQQNELALRNRQARLTEIEIRLSEILGLTNPQNPDAGSAIALAGRVSVLVCDENGAIKAGDAITSSSLAGYGMKATKSGPVVGYAMGELQEGQGSVTLNVTRSWFNPTSQTNDKGQIVFTGQSTYVKFAESFANSLQDVPLVTVSPVGSFCSLYVSDVTTAGFKVFTSNIEGTTVNWIAIAK